MAVHRVAVRPRLWAPFAAATLTMAALAGDVAFDPARRHVPLCPFHAATGWQCPLCGGLRAADALVHGQLGTALRDNLLLVAAVPLLVLWWLDWTGRRRAGVAARTMPRAVVLAVVVVGAAYTVVRNLPFAAALRPS